MTRSRFETLENAIFDFENENESFDFWEDNSFYELDLYNDWWEEKYANPYNEKGYFVDENGVCSCPEWFILGFNSEADYMHYLGTISGLS